MRRRPFAEAARLQDALARWLLEGVGQGIVATDSDLRIVAWNPWMEIYAHHSAVDVLGRSLLELYPDLVSRGIDGRFHDALTDGRVSTLSQGLHGYVLRLPPTHPDLELPEMPQSGRIGPLLDGDQVIGTLLTIENVSERLASEAELRRQVEAQKDARATAEAALRAKDEFLSIFSHELRTPLNAVLGWARILLTRTDADAATVTRALTVIERNAAAQAAMIDDILDVARVRAGKLRLELQPTDAVEVVLAAIDVVEPSATAKQIVIRHALDARTPELLADRRRLQQIAWNLLSNAVKFTPAGGTIDVALSPVPEGVRLVVSDSGQGVDPAFLPYVFDRFRQSDVSSGRRQGGLGLGLALVHDLVTLHGGQIAVESPGVGRGTAFTILLPTGGAPAAEAAVRTGADPATLSLSGVQALIVESDADSRTLLAAAVSSFGAEAVPVSSVAEALEMLESPHVQPFDVIVSDIALPGEDGCELLRRIGQRDQDRQGRIPAVAVSGHESAADHARALAAGFHVYVAKPIEPAVVARAVRRAIRDASVS